MSWTYKMAGEAELVAFAAKVERLKAEGLTTRAVAERLGVPVATLNDRLRRVRAAGGIDARLE